MLNIAKKRIPNCKFLLQSCEDSFYPNESLEYITASYCYRNVNDLSKALETSHQSLKPDGYLLILDMFKPSNMVYLRLLIFNIWCSLNDMIFGHFQGAYNFIPSSIKKYKTVEEFIDFVHPKFRYIYSKSYMLGSANLLVLQKISIKNN